MPPQERRERAPVGPPGSWARSPGRCRRRGSRGKTAQCTGTAQHHSWVPVLSLLPRAAAQHLLSAHPQPKRCMKIGCMLLYFIFPSLPLLSPSRPARPSPRGCRAVPRGCRLVLRHAAASHHHRVLRERGVRLSQARAECSVKGCFSTSSCTHQTFFISRQRRYISNLVTVVTISGGA